MPDLLWRISEFHDLTGLAGELTNGRWHTAAAEKRIVYFAEHPAVALVEVLANLRGDPLMYPDSFQLLKIAVSAAVRAVDLTPRQISSIDPHDAVSTQTIGDAWLEAKTSALLRVPSVPSPESWNYLLNPVHPDAASIKLDWAKRITYDRRLFHLGG